VGVAGHRAVPRRRRGQFLGARFTFTEPDRVRSIFSAGGDGSIVSGKGRQRRLG